MPDQYGNPTEADYRQYGYAPPTYVAPASNPGSFNSTGTGYSDATRAAVDARNNSGISTRDIYSGDQLLSHEERATPQRDNSADAQSFQSAFNDGTYYTPYGGTNRDYLGGGKFGIRGWMNQHPVGTMAAFIAAAAGGAAAMPAAGGGAAAGAGGGSAVAGNSALAAGTGAGTGTGLGTGAAGGLQASSGLGIFANGGAGGLAGVGGGNAGALAASGAITGGAGTGFMGSLGGNGLLSANSIQNATRLNGLIGGGDSGGGGSLPYMGLGSNYGQPAMQQAPQQQAGLMGSQMQPRMLPSMNQPLQSFSRKPLQFSGQTIWI
jgi:hypothetical protein